MKRVRPPRSAYTLLELVAATFIVGFMMVPTTSLLRDVVVYSTKIETLDKLKTLAVSQMERECGSLADEFRGGDREGDFARLGSESCRYRITRSDRDADGGIPGKLMTVRVLTWFDENRNRRPDADERYVELFSKVANRSKAE